MNNSLDQFYAPVGKVIVLFNHIEISLIMLAQGMCISEFPVVSALMAEASFGRKLDALKCMADVKLKNNPLMSEFNELLKKLQAAEEIRNRISHTVWMKSADDKYMKMKWSAKRKTGNDPGLGSASICDIEEAGKQIQETSGELMAFMQNLQRSGVLKIKYVQD